MYPVMLVLGDTQFIVCYICYVQTCVSIVLPQHPSGHHGRNCIRKLITLCPQHWQVGCWDGGGISDREAPLIISCVVCWHHDSSVVNCYSGRRLNLMTFARPVIHEISAIYVVQIIISARSWVQSEVRNFISLHLATTVYRSPGKCVFLTEGIVKW